MKPSLAGPIEPRGVALGLLEVESIAAGYETADAVSKRADVQLLVAQPVSSGKFLVLFSGEVSDVNSALQAGRSVLAAAPLDELFLPYPHPSLAEAINGTRSVEAEQALGVLETSTVSTLLVAADIAVKTAAVELLRIRLAMGMGGKAFVTLRGEVSQVRAALHAAAGHAEQRAKLIHAVVIPRPAGSLEAFLS